MGYLINHLSSVRNAANCDWGFNVSDGSENALAHALRRDPAVWSLQKTAKEKAIDEIIKHVAANGTQGQGHFAYAVPAPHALASVAPAAAQNCDRVDVSVYELCDIMAKDHPVVTGKEMWELRNRIAILGDRLAQAEESLAIYEGTFGPIIDPNTGKIL